MRNATFLFAALASTFLITTEAARADVIYSITGQGTNASFPTTFSLDFTDAQVASGSFTLQGSGRGAAPPDFPNDGPIFTGNVNGFVSFNLVDIVTPTSINGSISANLTFGPNDALNTINLNFEGADGGGLFTGTGSNTTVAYGSDNPRQCAFEGNSCVFTGAWTVTVTDPTGVPEPATFAVLGAGLLGMIGLRRRFTDRSTREV